MTYYDETSKGYNELHGEEQLKKLKIIAKEIKIKKSTKMLDVGCGSGLSAKVFDCDITGIDPSEELLKQCPFKAITQTRRSEASLWDKKVRTKVRGFRPAHFFIKASAESIPFPDKSFDVVIAVTSIHNFNGIEAGLKEIKRVGKNTFALTILKKSPKKDSIIQLIKNNFKIKKEIDEEKDLIFICC